MSKIAKIWHRQWIVHRDLIVFCRSRMSRKRCPISLPPYLSLGLREWFPFILFTFAAPELNHRKMMFCPSLASVWNPKNLFARSETCYHPKPMSVDLQLLSHFPDQICFRMFLPLSVNLGKVNSEKCLTNLSSINSEAVTNMIRITAKTCSFGLWLQDQT